EQLAFESVFGEDAFVLRHPEKRLGGIDGRVGDAQLVGGAKLGGKIALRAEQDEKKPRHRYQRVHGTGLIQGSPIRVKPARGCDSARFVDNRNSALLRRNTFSTEGFSWRTPAVRCGVCLVC